MLRFSVLKFTEFDFRFWDTIVGCSFCRVNLIIHHYAWVHDILSPIMYYVHVIKLKATKQHVQHPQREQHTICCLHNHESPIRIGTRHLLETCKKVLYTYRPSYGCESGYSLSFSLKTVNFDTTLIELPSSITTNKLIPTFDIGLACFRAFCPLTGDDKTQLKML